MTTLSQALEQQSLLNLKQQQKSRSFEDLLFVEFLLLRHEAHQILSGHGHLFRLGGVRRGLRGVRVLLAVVLADAFLPLFRVPLPPSPAPFMFPAGDKYIVNG